MVFLDGPLAIYTAVNTTVMCAVSVCVLFIRYFIIAAHLGNKVIFYQLSPLALQVTV